MNKTLIAIACSLVTMPVMAKELTLTADAITVSGLSSGGYMANQFHLAYSDRVDGAAIISAGPFYCAQNDITVALGAVSIRPPTPLISISLMPMLNSWPRRADWPR
ncbi:hypothetical protein [Salinimonas marina]|uniref:hypothetical protein n=1 Tax=Salinimonas marina TaxID=2785918 RepID=UPI001E314425|nr:hypothetical protein [Salinimonas marina]